MKKEEITKLLDKYFSIFNIKQEIKQNTTKHINFLFEHFRDYDVTDLKSALDDIKKYENDWFPSIAMIEKYIQTYHNKRLFNYDIEDRNEKLTNYNKTIKSQEYDEILGVFQVLYGKGSDYVKDEKEFASRYTIVNKMVNKKIVDKVVNLTRIKIDKEDFQTFLCIYQQTGNIDYQFLINPIFFNSEEDFKHFKKYCITKLDEYLKENEEITHVKNTEVIKKIDEIVGG